MHSIPSDIFLNILTHKDIGYHYTDQRNLVHIRTHGLLTKAERKENKVHSTKQNASVFGDGIYTANNETNFSKYGDTCEDLIVYDCCYCIDLLYLIICYRPHRCQTEGQNCASLRISSAK